MGETETWRSEVAKLNQFSTDNYSKSSLDFVFSNLSIKNGKPVVDFMYYGSLKENDTLGSDITKYFEKYGFKLQSTFYEQKMQQADAKPFEDYRFSACYISKKGYVKIERRIKYGSKHDLYFDVSAYKEFVEETNFIEEFIDEFLVRKQLPKQEDNKEVFTLVATQNGYQFTPLGKIGRKFVADNYTLEVQEGFTKLVENIQAENPFGRLSILTGTPGTGKTFFIKGLIEEFDKVKFVMVDPQIMVNISGPQLINAFLNEANSDYPIVLCIEDADNCLVERMQDNMSYISSLLNLTDGIYGESLNIHVVASTNQKKVEVDPALARPGRLHNMIEFKKLSEEDAKRIYMRETDKEIEFEKKDANISNKKSKTSSKTGFGFSSMPEQIQDTDSKLEFTIAEIYNKIYKNGKKKKVSKVLNEEAKLCNLSELIF